MGSASAPAMPRWKRLSSLCTCGRFVTTPAPNVTLDKIYATSRLLTTITGVSVPPNKAVVGANAFAHEAGIHQDGILKNPLTYEIIVPEKVGVPAQAAGAGEAFRTQCLAGAPGRAWLRNHRRGTWLNATRLPSRARTRQSN